MSDLAALVASKHWRWLTGMSAYAYGHLETPVIVTVNYFEPSFPYSWVCSGDLRGIKTGNTWPSEMRPDLEDPATLGCLLALVREAWADPMLSVQCQDGESWELVRPASYHCEVVLNSRGHLIEGPTEAKALVAAILAAP